MINILTYHDIDQQQWQQLIERSPYATWFQTDEAYRFYQSVGGMQAFAYGVAEEGRLVGVIVGYTTQEKCIFKQYFTARTIIPGGPLLDEHISSDAISALLVTVKRVTKNSIYVETRNFHNYSHWRDLFEDCKFQYQPHLNFHVDTSSVEVVDKNLGKSRKRDMRTTIRDGVTPVLNPTIEQVRTYYALLQQLYTTKIKTPLFSWDFFEKLYAHPDGRFILVELNGEIIGGTVCVELSGKCLYEWFVCGRDGEWKSIFPSSLATYAGIRYAAEHGCSRFDMMGAGKPDEAYGVRDFKAKFGGELVEHGRFLHITKPMLYKIGTLGVKILKKIK